MTRREHITAVICYAVLSLFIAAGGLCFWIGSADGSFEDFLFGLLGAYFVQAYGAGRHVRALEETE